MTLYVSVLFQERPNGWGLRGDPPLWDTMERLFEGTPLPSDDAVLRFMIERIFLRVTGQPVSTSQHFYVASMDVGGMSHGLVSPQYWREQAIPLLVKRYGTLHRTH